MFFVIKGNKKQHLKRKMMFSSSSSSDEEKSTGTCGNDVTTMTTRLPSVFTQC